jgi:orotidine-5'-phosphate decarboxylase
VIAHGSNDHGGLLINSSRGILFADSSENYAKAAAEVAAKTANL